MIFALAMCGAVAATEETTGGEGGLPVDQPLSGFETTNAEVNELTGPIIGVKVNYEYANDVINPGISLKDANGEAVDFTKTYDAAFQGYKLEFLYPGASEGSKFKVTLTAPGYKTQEQEVTVNKHPTDLTDPNLYANIVFNMVATDNYRLGREVTKKANELLNFATADEVLCITTAGVPKRNGTTSEDAIEGIINQANGLITDGKGNLLLLKKTPVDPVDFAFVVKRGNQLLLAYFYNGTLTPSYVGTISASMTDAQWTNAMNKIGKDTYPVASLANAWAVGTPTDLLKAAAFHGHMCDGTISGYAMTEVLLKYFPPEQETLTHAGAPADKTAYRVITIPGDSKDDVFLTILNIRPGSGGALSGYDTSEDGATQQMAAFIRWNDVLKTGTIIVLSFNRAKFQEDFFAATGLSPNQAQHDHSHDDVTQDHVHTNMYPLKLTTWLLGKLNQFPEQYIDILLDKDGLTEEAYFYLLGSASEIKNPDGTVRIEKTEAAGLDLTYIAGLGLPDAVRAVPANNPVGTLTPEQMKQIGIDAANLAKEIFFNEKGIILEKDDRDLLVQTSAGYVRFNGQLTDMTMDGIFEVLGSRLSRYTLLPMHNAPWKPLYFTFTLRGADGVTMDSIYMSYDPETLKFWVGTSEDGKQVNDIGPNALNVQARVNDLSRNVFKEGNWFNIQSIANAWRNDPPFDQLVTFLYHDHACPGVQPGFFIVDKVLTDFPLSGQENYFWIASSIYCKDDSLIYLMGISPGSGTYMSQRLLNEDLLDNNAELPSGTDEGLLVIWDPVNKVGRAVIVTFEWARFDMTGLTTNEARREAQIAGFVALYKNEEFARLISPIQLETTEPKYITAAEFELIKQGGGADFNSHDFLRSLPFRPLSDLIQVPGGDHQHGDGGHTHDGTGGHTHDGTGGHTHGPGGHVHSGTVGHSHTHAAAQTHSHAAPELEAGEELSGEEKAYEVSKTQPSTENQSDVPVYAIIIGILAIGGLAAFGFLRGGFGLFGK